MPVPLNDERDRGGRILPGKKWINTYYLVQVATEYPSKEIDLEEAEEDSAEFMASVAMTKGRANKSFCTIIRVEEIGPLRPITGNAIVVRDPPNGEQAQVEKKKIKKAKRRY